MKIFNLLLLCLLFSCSSDGTFSSNADDIFCPQVNQYITPEQCSIEVAKIDSLLCINQPTGLKATYKEKYHKGNNVWHYIYDLPGISVTNCDFKFLFDPGLNLKADTIELVRFKNRDIGEALYIVYKVDYINSETSNFWLKQIRETYKGVYNNDGICDGGSAPALPYFYVRLTKCNQYTSIGDSFGLKAIFKI